MTTTNQEFRRAFEEQREKFMNRKYHNPYVQIITKLRDYKLYTRISTSGYVFSTLETWNEKKPITLYGRIARAERIVGDSYGTRYILVRPCDMGELNYMVGVRDVLYMGNNISSRGLSIMLFEVVMRNSENLHFCIKY